MELGPYFHSAANKSQADELLLADGGDSQPGKFLFRPRTGVDDEYILSVIYKGQATHHKVVFQGGELSVNNTPTGCSSLVELTAHLGEKRPKWPVPLVEGVPGDATDSGTSHGAGGDSSATDSGDNESFNHGMISKSDADALLLSNDGANNPGKFLFRQPDTSGDKYILSVIYKGQGTHHMCARSGPGAEFTVNNQPTGCTSISEIKTYLEQKRPKWPVPLTTFVPKDAVATETPASKPEPASTPTPASAPAPSSAPAASSSSGADDDIQVHTGCNKAQSEALLLADGGSDVPGKFLFRGRDADGLEFILSVIYKGQPTHHKVTRESSGDEFSVNKQPTGQTSIAGVATYLGQKRPKWPVPLTEVVQPGDGGTSSVSSPAPSPSPAASQKSSDSPKKAATPASSNSGSEFGAHFHGGISKAEAESLLGDGSDGKFLVRSKGDSTDTLILSVIYRGKPTHHMLIRSGPGDDFTLNKQPIGCKSVPEVETYLNQKRPKWPVPLTEGVPSGDSGPDNSAPTPVEKDVPRPPSKSNPTRQTSGFAYVHPSMSKDEADRLLLADGGSKEEGKFLFREKKGNPGEYVLSVIYRGKGTHHNVSKDPSNPGKLCVNKQPTGCSTAEEIATYLKQKRPKWPVPLTTGVPGPNSNDDPAPNVSDAQPVSVGKGHSRSNSGDNGFTNWTPPPQNTANNGPADPPNVGDGPTGSVQKRSITKTWRRKKLAALESKPTVLGQWATDGHGSRSHAYGNYDVDEGEVKSQSTLKKIKSQGSVALDHGLMLTKSAHRRLVDPGSTNTDDASSIVPEIECTYLGNCQCPKCV